MENTKHTNILTLDRLVVDSITFNRKGFKGNYDISFNLNAKIAESDGTYTAYLELIGDKKEEYNFTISMVGYFTFETNNININKDLLSQNIISIIIPYLRSQVSLLTSQPGMEPVIMPIINVQDFLNKEN